MTIIESWKVEKLRARVRVGVMTVVCVSGATMSMAANADLTWFSRANCINNESISWHAFNAEWLWTNTYHYKNGAYLHCDNNIGDGCRGNAWQQTWRAAAVHWNEGLIGGFTVYGKHWRWTSSTGTYLLGNTYATGCNPTHW